MICHQDTAAAKQRQKLLYFSQYKQFFVHDTLYYFITEYRNDFFFTEYVSTIHEKKAINVS